MSDETVLQFGAGRLLRALVDWAIHEASVSGQNVGKVVVVQSTEGDRVRHLNRQAVSHIVVRGLSNGKQVDEVQEVGSISRGLIAQSEWPAVLEVARSPKLAFIVSNTTEKGYDLNPEENAASCTSSSKEAPKSFPAKLLAVLLTRFESGLPGVTVLPTELIDGNASILKSKVAELAKTIGCGDQFCSWLEKECLFRNTLVDRIVPGAPKDHPLLQEDPLAVMAEPYALWAIENHPGEAKICEHRAIVYAPDVQPYFLRKVRELNGAHTALVCHWIRNGRQPYQLVREAMAHATTRSWLEELVFNEIVPTITDRVVDAQGFAKDVFDRFANPYIDHKLADIELYHSTKVEVRLKPTVEEYTKMFGKPPKLLTEVLHS